MDINKIKDELFLQSDYDFRTAEFMFQSERYFYTIFMCHLSLEKCLKGLYAVKIKNYPPKTHNLIYLIEKMSLDLIKSHYDFILSINTESVATRYPDDINKALKSYNRKMCERTLNMTREVLNCLKNI